MLQEVAQPFFIFQLYSVVLWCFEDYVVFALSIAVLATFSLYTAVNETHGSLARVADMARFEVSLSACFSVSECVPCTV
jgi:cation-transporting ATPase 13A3/4/5